MRLSSAFICCCCCHFTQNCCCYLAIAPLVHSKCWGYVYIISSEMTKFPHIKTNTLTYIAHTYRQTNKKCTSSFKLLPVCTGVGRRFLWHAISCCRLLTLMPEFVASARVWRCVLSVIVVVDHKQSLLILRPSFLRFFTQTLPHKHTYMIVRV